VAENFTLYAQTYDALPEEQMRRLAGDADFSTGTDDDGGRRFAYSWPGLSVTVHEMPARDVPGHLAGFRGYVRHIYGGQPDERGERVLDRISHTRLVAGVVVEPARDEQGRAEQVLGSMAYGLHALMFYGSALFDRDSKLILAPDGSFDPDADILGPVAEMIKDRVQVKLPEAEPYRPTPAQEARYRRVLAELHQRKVPTLSGALFIDDDEATMLRAPAEVARRLLVLHAVTVRADGGPREEALPLIERHGLWPAVSPEERRLLEAEEADEGLARKLLWRLEGMWVLAWALGEVEELPWPAGFCDVPRRMRAVRACGDRAGFVEGAALRPKAEVLDARQLTLLQHWAVRDAFIHNRQVPTDLDWSGGAAMAPVRGCPVTGVVAERHHTLNWLVRFGDADWDDVDTPT
jgi:hypothetical protein